MLEPVSDCWPRRMATTAQAEQNPAYMSTPPIPRTHHYLTVVMGFLLYIDVNYLDFLKIRFSCKDLGEKYQLATHNVVEITCEISTLKR